MTDGATENVTPIHSADATDVSTDTEAVLVMWTDVWLEAVATAPPDSQTPVPTAVELAPACPMVRKTSV